MLRHYFYKVVLICGLLLGYTTFVLKQGNIGRNHLLRGYEQKINTCFHVKSAKNVNENTISNISKHYWSLFNNEYWSVLAISNEERIAVGRPFYIETPDQPAAFSNFNHGLFLNGLTTGDVNISNGLFCTAEDSLGRSANVSAEVKFIHTIGELSHIHNRKYYKLFIWCPLVRGRNDNTHLCYSNGSAKACVKLDIVVPNDTFTGEFGLCVPPLYGTFTNDPRTAAALVEWVEWYKLQGITHFYMYNTSLQTGREFGQVLRHYLSDGIVSLTYVPTPVNPYAVPTRHLYAFYKIVTEAALSDCLLRNVHRHRYLLIVDLDEIVVPVGQDGTFKEMMTQYLPPSSKVGISLSSHLVLIEPRVANSSEQYLLTRRYNSSVYIPRVRKSFLNPSRCRVSSEHLCILHTGLGSVTARLPVSRAICLHFRRNCAAQRQLYANGSFVIGGKRPVFCDLFRSDKFNLPAHVFSIELRSRVETVLNSLQLSHLTTF